MWFPSWLQEDQGTSLGIVSAASSRSSETDRLPLNSWADSADPKSARADVKTWRTLLSLLHQVIECNAPLIRFLDESCDNKICKWSLDEAPSWQSASPHDAQGCHGLGNGLYFIPWKVGAPISTAISINSHKVPFQQSENCINQVFSRLICILLQRAACRRMLQLWQSEKYSTEQPKRMAHCIRWQMAPRHI